MLDTGEVKTFGANGNGQLGLGTTVNTSTPTTVPSLLGVTKVALGAYHSLFLTSKRK